ncbi:MAG: GGDEF domain-containing protein [Thermomicrobiales bacterium]
MLYLDVDYFKRTNDMHGHAEGDRVLVELARALREMFGPDACIGRFGGDEFTIFLSETPNAPIVERVESLRKCAATIPVTISVGSASVRDTGMLAEAMARADAALLAAKAAGRNRHVGEAEFAALSAVA